MNKHDQNPDPITGAPGSHPVGVAAGVSAVSFLHDASSVARPSASAAPASSRRGPLRPPAVVLMNIVFPCVEQITRRLGRDSAPRLSTDTRPASSLQARGGGKL